MMRGLLLRGALACAALSVSGCGVVEISTFPGDTCDYAEEGYPTKSINSNGGISNEYLFAGYNHLDDRGDSCDWNGAPERCQKYNWTSKWNGWTSHSHLDPPIEPGFCAWADSWSTTSGGTGLEYVSAILTPKDGAGECTGNPFYLGIGAGTLAELQTGSWSFPIQRISAPSTGCVGGDPVNLDGSAIHFDLAATRLWATSFALGAPDRGLYLQIMNGCQYGAPGQPGGCPVTSCERLTADIGSHPNVHVNACTHNAVVAYRSADLQTVRIEFRDPGGAQVGTPIEWVDQPYAPNTNCQGDGADCADPKNPLKVICKCGGPTSPDCGSQNCLFLVPRVHLDTTYRRAGGRCYLYASWDRSYTTSDGDRRMASRLVAYDITNEASPALVGEIDTASWYGFGNQWNSATAVNWFKDDGTGSSANVGLFYYHDDGTHCNTTFRALLSTSVNLANPSEVALQGIPFPNIAYQFGNPGPGEYVGAVRYGLPGGYLFATWANPVSTTATCTQCQGTQYGLQIMGARVLP